MAASLLPPIAYSTWPHPRSGRAAWALRVTGPRRMTRGKTRLRAGRGREAASRSTPRDDGVHEASRREHGVGKREERGRPAPRGPCGCGPPRSRRTPARPRPPRPPRSSRSPRRHRRWRGAGPAPPPPPRPAIQATRMQTARHLRPRPDQRESAGVAQTHYILFRRELLTPIIHMIYRRIYSAERGPGWLPR